jgi:sterol desaturase/sphingolipid hydroxylase (fatty acid hydroxylase superfamily)
MDAAFHSAHNRRRPYSAWRNFKSDAGFTMQTFLYHATTVAVVAVIIVLILGLWNMTRGTSPNLSQKLMRWRVGLQFVAILIIIAYVIVRQHGG